MQEKYLMTIRAKDRPGLLHLITGKSNRELVPIISLNAAETDHKGTVLVSMEILIAEHDLELLVFNLKNITGIFAVDARPLDRVVSVRSVLFCLRRAFLESPLAKVLEKYPAQIISFSKDTIIINISGCESQITRFYEALASPDLLGLCQTAPIAESKLLIHEG